ncbi:MAG TPA: ABC transporter substrate-binding protein [Thermoleophilaceae bacterium]|jgi:polar amino acid transport system substrate-binding protein
MTRRIPRLIGGLAALSIAAAVVAGCGSSNSNTTSTPASTGAAASTTPAAGGADAKVAAEVPAAIKSKGTLTVAADATYAPNEFIGSDGHTVEGMDADLAQALAQTMGLKAKVVNATFDSIIPGLASHKYDLGMSSFTDTKERQKTVNFVTYFSAGTSFYEKASGGPALTGLASLCGTTVAVEKGTTQQDDSTAQSKKCTSAGKKPVKVLTFTDQNGANLAINSGRAQVGMADSPVADYQVKKSSGQFKLVGTPYGTAPYGIALPKDLKLEQPVLDALKVLMSNGKYKAILTKWGIASGAISNPQINGAIS